MARASHRCRPDANTERHRDANQDDRSHDGSLGGAAQIAQPDNSLAIGDAAEADARFQLAWELAGRRRVPHGSDKPHAVLDAGRGAMAEILDRYDDKLDKGRDVI